MKNWLFAILVLGLLTLLVLLVFAPTFRGGTASRSSGITPHPTDTTRPGIEGTLTFCSDIWPPYVNDPEQKQRGYSVELLQAIYSPAGFQV